MQAILKRGYWRYLAVGLMSLALVTTTAFAFVNHSHASAPRQAAKRVTIHAKGSAHVTYGGMVDLATMPKLSASAAAALSAKPGLPILTPLSKAQQAAYKSKVAALPSSLPKGSMSKAPGKAASAAQVAQNAQLTANFDAHGYSDFPIISHSFKGQKFSESGGWIPPDSGFSSNPTYLLQADNNVLSVYLFSGTRKYGPISSFTFFKPIMHSGDFMSDPQVFWDPTRLRWEITYLEVNSTTLNDFIDIAVSTGMTPTITTGTTFMLYQVNVTGTLGTIFGSPSFCDYDTMGNDFWGLYVNCTIFSTGSESFQGNAVFALDKTDLYTHVGVSGFFYVDIPLDISAPAFRLSMTNEDATPDAEFLVATDAGYGGPFNGLTTCAFTNTNGLNSGVAPSATCVIQGMPVNYSDPAGGRQPGTSALTDPGLGTKQLSYINGNLYLSQSTFTGLGNDGIWWAIVTPQLTQLDPSNPQNQAIQATIIDQNNVYAYGDANTDAYDPMFMGTEQGDADLVFNYSSNSGNTAFTADPSIVYTARRASDAPNFLEPGGIYVIKGINPNGSGRWGDYSACSLDTNMTSRGLVWCAMEYGGPSASASGNGWDTWIFSMQS